MYFLLANSSLEYGTSQKHFVNICERLANVCEWFTNVRKASFSRTGYISVPNQACMHPCTNNIIHRSQTWSLGTKLYEEQEQVHKTNKQLVNLHNSLWYICTCIISFDDIMLHCCMWPWWIPNNINYELQCVGPSNEWDNDNCCLDSNERDHKLRYNYPG